MFQGLIQDLAILPGDQGVKVCSEYCPGCMFAPGNGVKSEQPPMPVFTDDGQVVMIGGGDKDGGHPPVLVDTNGQPLVDELGQPLPIINQGGAGLGSGQGGAVLVDGGKQGGAVLVDGGKQGGGAFVDGGKQGGGVFVDGGKQGGAMFVDGGKQGGAMLVDGDKDGGALVDGGLLVGGEKKTGGQFVVGERVHDKEGYLVGKDGTLVNSVSCLLLRHCWQNRFWYLSVMS